MTTGIVHITDKNFRITIPEDIREVENIKQGDFIQLDIIKLDVKKCLPFANRIEFKCQYCGAKNKGTFALYVNEGIKNAIDTHNDFVEKQRQKNPDTNMVIKSTEACKYVTCQLCKAPNYLPLTE